MTCLAEKVEEAMPEKAETAPDGHTEESRAGVTAFLATIGVGVGGDDTADTVGEAEFATIGEARSWVERMLPTAQFPEWIERQPHGSLGAFLFGSIQRGHQIAAHDGSVSWVSDLNSAEDLNADLVDGRVHWRSEPETLV
jgi:hypothetical protein